MKKINIIFILIFLINLKITQAREPFVVIENRSTQGFNDSKIDNYNPFLMDSNYSKIHDVKEGESLSGIIKKYYNKTGLNMRIVEISIIEMNKKAFVRNNPHYLYAGKKIKIPSINEIMNLVKKSSNRENKSSTRSHIYFFGSN